MGQSSMAAMQASLVVMLAAFNTLALAQAKSPYDSCTCPDANGIDSWPLGLIQYLCPIHNVSTARAPITGRSLFNEQTGLCKAEHCCEYEIGKKPQLAPNGDTSRGDAALLVGTWVLMAVCGGGGLVLYMLQPFLVRHFEHADIRRRLLTLFASLLGAVGFSLGSDLLLYSTAINQAAYGDGWAESLSPLLDAAMAVDAVAAFMGVACICIWLFGRHYIIAKAIDGEGVNLEVQRDLLNGMMSNINQVTARLVKSMMAGILCTLLILVTPEKILYDGSSGVVIINYPIMDSDGKTPLQTHDINVAKLNEINLLVDVLLGLIMLPLFQSMLQNAAAAINLIWTFIHVKTELSDALRPPRDGLVTRSAKRLLSRIEHKSPMPPRVVPPRGGPRSTPSETPSLSVKDTYAEYVLPIRMTL